MAAHENLHPEQFPQASLPDPHIYHGQPGYSERVAASSAKYREERDTREAFDKIIQHSFG